VNARGAIARFDRMALEIRVLDVQECPAADLAIAGAVACVLEALCDPAPDHQARLRGLATPSLAALLARTTADADAAIIDDADLLSALGLPVVAQRADAVWGTLVERHVRADPRADAHLPALDRILAEGPLARRILRRTGPKPDRTVLTAVYGELAECLRTGRLFPGETVREGC
jgi:hypothetical protein